MTDQLTELTTAQWDRLPVFLRECIAAARRTTPLTETEWHAWENGMRGYYADAGRDWPGVVVRVGSPLVGSLAAEAALRVLRGRRRPPQRRSAVDPAEITAAVDAVIDATLARFFRFTVREGAETGMDPKLRAAAASTAACAALSTAPTPAVPAPNGGRRSAWVKPRKRTPPEPRALVAAVDRRLYREVFHQLCPAMFYATEMAVDLPVEFAVIGSIPMEWRRAVFARSHSRPIVAAFFRNEVTLPLAEDVWRFSRAYQDALLTRWWWPTRDFIMVCDRPVELHLDPGDRLHNDSGPALRWADGWGLCFWHGTQVPADLIDPRWTPEQILDELNVETRRCAIERIGWDRFVVDARLTELDRTLDPANPGQLLRLYHVPGRGTGRDMRVLLCTNATRERNGERHSFGLTMPVDCPTALAGAAWSFDLTEAEYATLARAT